MSVKSAIIGREYAELPPFADDLELGVQKQIDESLFPIRQSISQLSNEIVNLNKKVEDLTKEVEELRVRVDSFSSF